MNINNELKGVLKTLSIDLDDRTIANINMYLDILFSWHAKNNILSTRDPSYFLKRDFFDSLSMLPYLPSGPILDIGTGAGIPGILLAFIRNTENIVLLDRRDNAIRFLEHAKLKLCLQNVDIIKSDVNKLKMNVKPSAILMKNFSNKIISKMDLESKLCYIISIIRNKLGFDSKIFLLSGSNMLDVNTDKESYEVKTNSKLKVIKIETPYFQTNRYLLEISDG
ncbi:MAG: hypothetical protein CBE17_02675 [Gammaproteobacteria bacterium TMED257]|nr:MAG: hypothetical protein CBE17_02675 [Gammaproteobacteria bacterium TMED257]|tara:strand:+ start:906 stop:1574 length:669 start_codon:yes stop_codon:yes gene_type:complete